MPANYNSGTRMYYIRKSDGLAYCFSPVPLIESSRENITFPVNEISQRLGSKNKLTFVGTLLPELPALTGVNPDATCLELLDRKSDQLEAALAEDYGNLLIIDASGYPVVSEYPRIASIEFGSSQMINKRDYQIVFEYESQFQPNNKISEFADTWSFNENEDDTANVTHNVSAVGVNDVPAGTGALEYARNFVLQRANSLDRTKYKFLTAPYVNTILDLNNLTEYNHIHTENADIIAGRYELSESWIMASGAFKDDRTVETTYELNEVRDIISKTTINGTVLGRGNTTFEKFTNAQNGFNNFVSQQINFAVATGVESKSRTDNRFAGSVTYNIVFTPAGTGLDAVLEDRTVTRQFQRNDDGTVTQTVSTSAKIRVGSDSGIQYAIDYAKQNNYPITSTYEPIFDATSASSNIETVSSSRDELLRSFSLTIGYRDQGSPNWREEYQISREQSVENARTTITVNGTIFGLASETGTKSTVRFNVASGAYYNTISPIIRQRAISIEPVGTCIGSNPVSQTLGYSILGGTVTYSQTFDNRVLTTNPNVRDENIEVSYNLQSDVIAEMAIPGKSDGPILQDQETVTGLEKSIRISYTMLPSGSACASTAYSGQYVLELEALAESNVLINNTQLTNQRGEKPIASRVFKTQDQYTFNRSNYTFNRNVTWKYPSS